MEKYGGLLRMPSLQVYKEHSRKGGDPGHCILIMRISKLESRLREDNEIRLGGVNIANPGAASRSRTRIKWRKI